MGGEEILRWNLKSFQNKTQLEAKHLIFTFTSEESLISLNGSTCNQFKFFIGRNSKEFVKNFEEIWRLFKISIFDAKK